MGEGTAYKYEIKAQNGEILQKTDPQGFWAEIRPKTASIVWDISKHAWGDAAWLAQRATRDLLTSPMAIYEVHLGSWLRVPETNGYLSYRDLAVRLADYVVQQGYTHIELMPITEHPLDASWGYQVTGYFAPTSRFGTPDDFQYFVDHLHQSGIGVILDWVPAHFPKNDYGLVNFDGTALYEYADDRIGEHQEWGTKVFNFARNEVRQFLLNSALFWLDKYHLDGLRVDAVASMLYRDYGRTASGCGMNMAAARTWRRSTFLRRMNELVYAEHPGAVTIAEESTSFPAVSRPTYLGGLGFTLQMEHGLDARHAGLHREGPDLPQVPPPEADFRPDVCVQRELRPADLARRGGAPQARNGRQDCPAISGSGSPTCGCTTGSCGRIPAKSCSSWARTSASGTNGPRRRAWTGI